MQTQNSINTFKPYTTSLTTTGKHSLGRSQNNIDPNQIAKQIVTTATTDSYEAREWANCQQSRPYFFEHYFTINNPKQAGKGETTLKFKLRDKQLELDTWVDNLIKNEDTGILTKSREEGATWYAVGLALWHWLFVPGSIVTLGSRKEELVDKSGDPDSLFEKIRFSLEKLPNWMLPKGYVPREHNKHLRITNIANGATIKGEAGDSMGRGGRSLLYIVDEWDFVERPEKVSRSINENARARLYISTVAGPATFMAEQEKVHPTFLLHWKDNPDKNGFDTETNTYPWYEKKKGEYAADPVGLAREIDANRNAASPGALIPNDWIQAAITLKLARGTVNTSGLDVSADRGDKIIYANRQGAVLTRVERILGDAIQTQTRDLLARDHAQTLYFDRLGVGAYAIRDIENNPNLRIISEGSAKSAFRLDHAYESKVKIVPLANSEKPSAIKYADRPEVIASERFYNRAAELGWSLRLRFFKTWERVSKGIAHPDDECISLNEFVGTPLLLDIERQLSQPTYEQKDSSGKIHVDKQGVGGKSPDIYEAIMYAFAQEEIKKIRPQYQFDTTIS
jgi:phage terminase large subunit